MTMLHRARRSLSSLLDVLAKAHSSSLRTLEAGVVFASQLVPQNCCRQHLVNLKTLHGFLSTAVATLSQKPPSRLRATACQYTSCVSYPMPELKCSGDLIRALALLAPKRIHVFDVR